nr:MAG TPA: hypothetical protein [Caudoviricetes sp.]
MRFNFWLNVNNCEQSLQPLLLSYFCGIIK